MPRASYRTSLCTLLVALAGAAGCTEAPATDDIVDLGTVGDGKNDTALPRNVAVELEPGEAKRFRIKTVAFVATLAQDDTTLAELTAKNYELAYNSEVVAEPRLEVTGDGSVRTWTLTIHNRGDATLAAAIVIDAPRASSELGIVSDIDKTILPPDVSTGVLALPYPGIATLLTTLDLRTGAAGDVHYVTARTPEAVVEIPDHFAMHGVPDGSFDTGISGVPWIAQAEKVRDISRLLDTNAGQRFVMFGDTSHRDPEAYREIMTKYPDRIHAAFIHKVNATVSATRVAGMHLVENYAQAAAILYGADLLTEDEARAVIDAAQAEGLALTDADEDALIDAAR